MFREEIFGNVHFRKKYDQCDFLLTTLQLDFCIFEKKNQSHYIKRKVSEVEALYSSSTHLSILCNFNDNCQ